jgi:histone deacetylase 1/2
VYADDIIITCNKSDALKEFTDRLNKIFALKNLCDLHFFLCVEVTRDDTGFYLSQRKYIEDLLTRNNMDSCKPCPTPIAAGKSLSSYDSEPMSNPTLYRSVVGALQYDSHTPIYFSHGK